MNDFPSIEQIIFWKCDNCGHILHDENYQKKIVQGESNTVIPLRYTPILVSKAINLMGNPIESLDFKKKILKKCFKLLF